MATSLVKSARELPEYWEVLRNLVSRDLKVKYQSSVLGFAWSLLNPALMLGIWYFVFHHAGLMRGQMPRYWAFLLSGMLAYQFIQGAIVEGSYAVRRNAGIIRKVYVPIEILVIAAVTLKLVEFLIQLGVALLLLMCLHRGGQIQFSFIKTLVCLPPAILLIYIFALGVSLPLAAWSVIYRDLDHLIGVTLYALFFLTPVFWPMNMMVEKSWGELLALNPMTHLVELFHGPLYWGTWPENVAVGRGAGPAWAIACAFVAITFIAGQFMFDRSKRILAEVV